MADFSGIIGRVRRMDHEVSPDTVYAEPVLPNGGKVRTARNEVHLMASPSELSPEVPAHTTCADHGKPHTVLPHRVWG